jgi:hypothetical protein
MVATSSSSIAAVVLQPIQDKLVRNNHATWRAQVLVTLCGVRLDGYITRSKTAPAAELEEKQGDKVTMVINLEYEDWMASDQQVLRFLLASVTKEILVRVATAKMAVDAWNILGEQFSSQTRARAVGTRMALATTHKGNLSVAEYLAKMQSLGNDMVVVGHPLDDEDMV